MIDREEIIQRVVKGLPVRYWEVLYLLDTWKEFHL